METRTAGSESGLGKRTDGNIGTAPQADSTRIGSHKDDDVWWMADMRSVGMEWLLIESVNCAKRPWMGCRLTGGP